MAVAISLSETVFNVVLLGAPSLLVPKDYIGPMVCMTSIAGNLGKTVMPYVIGGLYEESTMTALWFLFMLSTANIMVRVSLIVWDRIKRGGIFDSVKSADEYAKY